MAWTTHLFMAVVMSSVLLSPTLCIEIITAPESVVVFIESKAKFTCETSQAQVTWNVNGTAFTQLPSQLRADLDSDSEVVGDNDVYTLTIPARAEYNGTVVQCVAGVLGGATVESGNATLMIQDVLAPVGNVSVESGHDSILLSWSPPFSLDVTGVDPDIWYTVLISNVTDEDNPTAIPCTDCHNLTQSHYAFTTANPSPCHKYSFTVIPQNGAGEGGRSEPVEGAFVDGAFVVLDVKSTVKFMTDKMFAVSLDLQLNGTATCGYCLVHIESEDGVSLIYITEPLPLLEGARLEFLVSTEDSGIKYNSKYLMTIEGRHRRKTSWKFLLSTFDIQSIDTTVDDGMIKVVGKFIVNSPAKGFLIIVKCNSLSPDRMVAVLNTSVPAVVTDLESNTYDIVAYDVEQTGLPNETPAVEVEDRIVSQRESMPTHIDSLALDSVTIDPDGDQVDITCHFKSSSSSSARCVIVSRKSTESVLMVEYYSISTDFPVKPNISEPGTYFVAVFGWSNEAIEPFPVKIQQVNIAQGPEPSSTVEAPQPPSDNQSDTIALAIRVAVAAAVAIVLAITVVIVIVLLVTRNHRHTPSSRDPCTQPNLAYELYKPKKRTIPMKQNIAYEGHTLQGSTDLQNVYRLDSSRNS